MKLQVRYDEEADVLYLAREGHEEEVVEISPGVNLEFDANRELIGVEILKASQVLNELGQKGGRIRQPGQENLPKKVVQILDSLRGCLSQIREAHRLPSTGETLVRKCFGGPEDVMGGAVNVIPGEANGRCQDVLLVFCWGRDSLETRLREAAEHAGERCAGANKWVIFLTDMWWREPWQKYRVTFITLNRSYGVRVFRVMLDDPYLTPVPLV